MAESPHIDLESALRSPATVFDKPAAVVEHPQLDRQEKIEILERWRYDALQLETAQSENLQSDNDTQLQAVLRALDDLGHTPRDLDTGL